MLGASILETTHLICLVRIKLHNFLAIFYLSFLLASSPSHSYARIYFASLYEVITVEMHKYLCFFNDCQSIQCMLV